MIKISIADFHTILLHAEKISKGQLDFIYVLRTELKNKLGIDNVDQFIDYITQNEVPDVQNQTRLFLAQFNFIIESDNCNYHLVKLNDNYCEIQPISEIEKNESKETLTAQALTTTNNAPMLATVTLDQHVIKIQFHLQNMANSAIIIGQELTECKKEVEKEFGYGYWGKWLEDNFHLKERMARNFMQVAERFGVRHLNAELNQTQLIAMLALPEGEEEKFIAEKAAEGTPVQDMTVKTLRAEIKNWKAESEKNKKESQKYKAESEEKAAEIEQQYAQINSLRNENFKLLAENGDAEAIANQLKKEIDQLKNNPVSVLPSDYEATKKENAKLQDTILFLQRALEQRAVESIPPDDYESNKEKIIELSTKIQQLKNQLAQNTVSIDTTTAKTLKFISTKIKKQLSKGADVVPRSDFEKLQKELHQLKLQQNPIFTSPTTAQFTTFYDLAETLSLKLLHPDSDLDYCFEYFEQDSISDLIANLQSITVDLERICKKKWG